MVPLGARVADVGTDHGYLGIHLLQSGISPHVIACDLRKGPLENARRNARQFGAQNAMEFRLSDGLEKIAPEEIDCAVLAGMGVGMDRNYRGCEAVVLCRCKRNTAHKAQ